MRNIGRIAARELVAAVANKGFIIGAVILPVLIIGIVMVVASRQRADTSAPRGEILLVDRTGAIGQDVRAAFDPRAIAERRARATRQALANVPPALGAIAAQNPAAVDQALGATPRLRIIERPADTDIAQVRAWLLEDSPASPHLAIVDIHDDALLAAEGGTPGDYDLYLPAYAKQRTGQIVREALREAIVNGRMRAHQLDRATVDRVLTVTPAQALTVTRDGVRPTNDRFDLLLPVLLVALLSMGILLGGQTLLASTVEEKSNRVMEVLLSAVSPFELMAGKLLGHLGVTLCIMGVHIALGLALLSTFALIGLFDPWLLLYFLVFLLVTYLMFGAVMSAIGAAVSDITEAQALVGPIMVVMVLAAMFLPTITRDSTSTLSVVLSFLPPMNTLAMMGRLASSVPPAAWEVWLTVAIGLAAALVTTWAAAKIFKVGLLMHGKPPDVATLVRWIRAA